MYSMYDSIGNTEDQIYFFPSNTESFCWFFEKFTLIYCFWKLHVLKVTYWIIYS